MGFKSHFINEGMIEIEMRIQILLVNRIKHNKQK